MSAPEQLQGYPIDYIQEVNQNLICCICHCPFIEPVTSLSCQHTFCKGCISEVIEHTSVDKEPTCPIDRTSINSDALVEAGAVVRNMLQELRVKCTFKGCEIEMERGFLQSHMLRCASRPVRCCKAGCGLEIRKDCLEDHAAFGCPKRQTSNTPISNCTCKEPTSDGHRWSCPQGKIPCPHVDAGCPEVISRNDIGTHLQTCFFEKIGPVLAKLNHRIQSLEDSNMILKKTLEGSGRVRGQQRIDDAVARIEADTTPGAPVEVPTGGDVQEGEEDRSSVQDLGIVVLHLRNQIRGMERTHNARATTGELTLREEVATLRGIVDVLRTQVMSGNQGTSGPSTPRPMSIRITRRHTEEDVPLYQESGADERPSNPRESIAFSSSHDHTDMTSETSSIISHITANNPMRRESRRPMGLGQPMGMPPEMGDGTPTVRVVVHGPSNPPSSQRTITRQRSGVLGRFMSTRAARSSRSLAQP